MKATDQASGLAKPASEQSGPAAAAPADAPRTGSPPIDWEALRTAGRACCCAASPAVIALIPPGPGRAHRTELLLCMHHFRACRQALLAAGASVVDLDRRIVAPDTPAYLTAESAR
jgi:hypothetical protein